MPRNATGTYSLTAGNPVVTGTLIESSWANNTMTDLSTEMTDSLSRSGKGGMLAPIRTTSGSAVAPSHSFTDFPTSGLYMAATGDVRLTVTGVDRMRWLAATNNTQVWDSVNTVWIDVGDVRRVGTPVDNQIGVWTSKDSLEGDPSFTFDGTTLTVPQIASVITGDVTGNLTGNVLGNVTGDVLGDVTGNLTGNADTVTTNADLTGPISSNGNATVVDPAQPSITSLGTLTGLTSSGTIQAPASTTTLAPINVPNGDVIAAPTDGDVWSTPSGFFGRVNGVTQPFGVGTYNVGQTTRNGVLNQLAIDPDTGTRSGFSAAIYTGNGTSLAVNTGVDMATDDFGGLVWMKQRNGAADSHYLSDTVRGTASQLYSNATSVEGTATTDLTSFDATGFTVGTGTAVNENTLLFAAWSWQTTKKIEPDYGSHLLLNTSFDVDLSNWTDVSIGSSGATQSGGRLLLTTVGSDEAILEQAITTVIGETYMLFIIKDNSANAARIRVGTASGLFDILDQNMGYIGEHTATFVAVGTTTYIGLANINTSLIAYVNNCNCRQINPAAITNRGKPYTNHYNPDLGFSIVGYQGDGLAGHEIPHHLGVVPELSMWKNRDTAGNWIVQSSLLNLGDFLKLNLSDAIANSSSVETIFSDSVVQVDTSSSVNNSGDDTIMYNFASVAGTSKIGKFIGTGAAGNYVDCGFGDGKAAFVLVKNLTSASQWAIFDQTRSGAEDMSNILYPDIPNVEGVGTVYGHFVAGGFEVSLNNDTANTLNHEYLFLAYAESATGGSGTNTYTNTDYDYPLDADTLTIVQDTLISFAQGFNSTGQIDSVENVGASVTHELGAGFEDKQLYLYKDLAGVYATTENRPLVGVTRDTADFWGDVSPLDVTLRTNVRHFDYESSTGVALASSEVSANTLAWGALTKLEGRASTGVTSDLWQVSTSTLSWWQYKQTEKRILKSWRMREVGAADQIPRLFTIEGSNDGLNWVAIDSNYTASSYVGNGADLWGDLQSTSGNTTAYLYHRINITANNGGANTGISEMEFNTILPSDYYLIGDGVMYEGTTGDFAQATNGTLGTGWSAINKNIANYAGSGVTSYLEAAVTGLANGVTYTLIVSLDDYTGSSDMGVDNIGGVSVSARFAADIANYTEDFVSDGTDLRLFGRATNTGRVTISVTPVVTPINRTYLAEFRTDSNGGIINSTLINTPVAKQNLGETEIFEDLTVHGEIKNTGVCTAWVNFDGTQDPPLIRDSYNVADVVDLGVGIYKVVFETPMDSVGYSATAIANDTYIAGDNGKKINYVGLTCRTTAAALIDGSRMTLAIFGGKK